MQVYDNSTNKYQVVENDIIIEYLTKSDGWVVLGDESGESQSLSKNSPLRVSLKQSNFHIWLVKCHK
ncbi:hypothetical protein [Candidatus Nitrosocosmicus arcticus]|uniref:Uncharacterized protein n=1 Tax=Candidatus Nitrosocosmicus arcticus TaxID=2035267 RepID=A0A557SUD0_9ARCH|nr:hypothetical protein [Candidatus Nitrosocosmicus arcticus]TVP40205.1 hypothetical protein NARC_90111 [Candidatus Nitrosocosmicus arcticus]